MQTVLSAFENQQTAQQAMDRLIKSGFSRQNVHLEAGQAGQTGGDAAMLAAQSNSSGEDSGFMASVGNFFTNLFGGSDSHHAGTYSEAVRRGNTVVAVDVMNEEEEERAADIMEECGAFDVDKHAEKWRASGWAGAGSGTTGAAGAATAAMAPMAGDYPATAQQQPMALRSQTPAAGNATMKVVQEELQVGKRSVDRGGVRVVQRISETPVQEMVRLRDEKAVVERRPVNREATEADFATPTNSTIEIRETSEEAVVGKTARVVEEVVVGKKVDERTETVTGKVRRKDVDVEQLDEHAMASKGTGLKETIKKTVIDPLAPRD